MKKKGYIFVTAFALFIAFSQTLKDRFFGSRNLTEPTQGSVILQVVIMFIVLLMPGLFIARWYYKNKVK